jgi:hypothetical protein
MPPAFEQARGFMSSTTTFGFTLVVQFCERPAGYALVTKLLPTIYNTKIDLQGYPRDRAVFSFNSMVIRIRLE